MKAALLADVAERSGCTVTSKLYPNTLSPAAGLGLQPPFSNTGGGEFSWHFNFAWEISRFKLTAKFPTRNSAFSANFSHTSSAHCIHSAQGAPRNFPQRNLPPRI